MTHAVGDVRKVDFVQLRIAATACCVDWKQNGPRDQAPEDATDDRHLEKSKEQEAIQAVMVEDIGVRKAEEVTEPIEQATLDIGSAFPLDRHVSGDSRALTLLHILRFQGAYKSPGPVLTRKFV